MAPPQEAPLQASLLHINITEFAAQLAVLRDSTLKGQAFVVAGEGDRAIVQSLSPAAREQGLWVGQTLAQARLRLRGLKVLSRDLAGERLLEDEIARLARERAPQCHSDGGGHFWLDISGTSRLFGTGIDNAAFIRRQLARELGIEAVLSLASNRLVAKVLSRSICPEGLAMVRAGEEATFMAHQSVLLLPGVGQGLGGLLLAAGIEEMGQLALLNDGQARMLLGPRGLALRDAARGIDGRSWGLELQGGGQGPCFGAGRRSLRFRLDFTEDVLEFSTILAGLYALCADAGFALRREKLGAARLRLIIRYADGVYRRQQRHAAAGGGRVGSGAAGGGRVGSGSGGGGRAASGSGDGLFSLDADIFSAASAALHAILDRRIRLRSCALELLDMAPLRIQYDLFEPQAPASVGSLGAGTSRGASAGPALQASLDQLRVKWGGAVVRPASSFLGEDRRGATDSRTLAGPDGLLSYD